VDRDARCAHLDFDASDEAPLRIGTRSEFVNGARAIFFGPASFHVGTLGGDPREVTREPQRDEDGNETDRFVEADHPF